MPPPAAAMAAAESFIARWTPSEQAERGNAQAFLSELCDLLQVPRPAPATGPAGPYRFERTVTESDAEDRESPRFIDLYYRDHFVLEAKQGANPRPTELFALQPEATRRQLVRNSTGWVRHMLEARGQAERYVRCLPPEEATPTSATPPSAPASPPSGPARSASIRPATAPKSPAT